MGLMAYGHRLLMPPGQSRWRWLRARPIFWITLLGAILRVLFISQPTVWTDEALVFCRACGTYKQLITALGDTAFAPLHYQAIWLLGHYFWLTPPVLRLIAVLSGILTVPAMHFLARQLVRRKIADLVALFTACSAYMLVYSRDAKMYPEFWLCCIVAMGFYLRWLRRGDSTGYLAWLAASVAMVGFDALGFIIMVLLPVFQISAKKPSWKKAVLTLAGMAIVSAGPVIYYKHFHKPVQRTEDTNLGYGTGTWWVPEYNQGRTGFAHLLYLTSSYLISWEWPRINDDTGESPTQDQSTVDPQTLLWLKVVTLALLASVIAGLVPWKRLSPTPTLPRSTGGGGKSTARDFGHTRKSLREGWRTLLWLAVWLVVPVYGFYCLSVPTVSSPLTIGQYFGGHWLAMAACMLASAVIMAEIWPRYPKWIAAVLLLALLLVVEFWVVPRLAEMEDHLVCATLVILGGAAWAAAPANWRDRLRVAGRAAIIAGVLLGLCQIVYRAVGQPTGSAWHPRYIAVVWPAFAVVLCWAISRIPNRAVRIGVVGLLLLVNLQRFVTHICLSINVNAQGQWIVEGTEPPIDLIAQDVVDSDTPRRKETFQGTVFLRPHSDTRTYVATERPGPGHPGTGTIDFVQGMYYLGITGGILPSPENFTITSFSQRPLFNINPNTRAKYIARDVAGSPQIHRVIVWDEITPETGTDGDAIIRQLGSKWDFISEMVFPAQMHWLATHTRTLRRREYVLRPTPLQKPPTAATQPSTAPVLPTPQ